VVLVVVGDAPYAEDYIKSLHASAGPNVIFTGYQFGDAYWELMSHAYVFVLASEVGGTHPVLVEAMAAGNCVVVNNTPANMEVVCEAGIPYDGAKGALELLAVLHALVKDESTVERYRGHARARAQSDYCWDTVTDRYERMFASLAGISVASETSVIGTSPGKS